jgi:hypothetical protein
MFRTISFLMLLCFTVGTQAAEIAVIPDKSDTVIIVISGELQPGDEQKFAQIAVQYHDAVVKLDSPGGRVLVGIDIGRAIRLKGFSTLADEDAICASACGYAYLASSQLIESRSQHARST